MTVLFNDGDFLLKHLRRPITICIIILAFLSVASISGSSNEERISFSTVDQQLVSAPQQNDELARIRRSNASYRAVRQYSDTSGSATKQTALHIGAIFPMSGQWAGGIGCRPSAEMAVEEVNSRSDILPNYKLVLDVRDSQCSPGLGTRMMYELLYKQPTKLMFLGPGCSLVSTFVAEAARSWNLLVLSWGSSSPALSDRRRFPTFFRTHPSAVLQNPVQIAMFKRWNWTRIAILQHIEEVFTTTVENLQVLAKEERIEISPRTSFAGADDVEQAIKQLKNQDARIIVGLFYENMARRVFCEAYRHGLYGSKYVWFIIGWFVDNWYELELNQTSCTADEMRVALEGHFTTESLMMNRNRSQVTWNGLTGQQFLERLEARYRHLAINDSVYRQNGSRLEGFVEAPLAYDAVWAMALAINRTVMRLARRNLLIENFTYDNDEIFRELHSSMQETKFLGISTEVQFTSQGDRNMLTQVEQFRNGRYHIVGYYDPNRPNETDWLDNHERVYWAEGKPPRDRTFVVDRYRHVNKTLYWTFCAFAWLMIACCLCCLAFTIVFKNFNCVRSTQPIFNQLMLFGFMLSLITVMLNGLDQEYIGEPAYTTLCTIRASLLCYGFSFSYGAMFCKIWMVYRVAPKRKNGSSTPKDETKAEPRGGYRHDLRLGTDLPNPPSDLRPIRSWEPKILFLLLIICDSLILMFLTIFDPLRRTIQKFPLETPLLEETTDDIKYQPLLELCTSATQLHAWLGLCFGYKGILLIAGLLLAYDTRNVKVDTISDSRFVALCVYNVVVLCIITASVSLIITDQQNPQFAFVSAVILLCTLLSLALIFGPKVLFILRYGVSGAAEMERKQQNETSRERQEQQKYRDLVAENEDLQRRIQSTDEKIRECKAKLNARIDQRVKLTATGTRDAQNDANRLCSNALVHSNADGLTSTGTANANANVNVKPSGAHEKTLRFDLNSINDSDTTTTGTGVNGTSGIYTTSEGYDAAHTAASVSFNLEQAEVCKVAAMNCSRKQPSGPAASDELVKTRLKKSNGETSTRDMPDATCEQNDCAALLLTGFQDKSQQPQPQDIVKGQLLGGDMVDTTGSSPVSSRLVVYTETCI